MKKLRLLDASLANLSTFSSLLPIAACLFKLRKINKRLYAIAVYCAYSLCSDLSFKYLHLKTHPDSQYFILTLFTIIEYSIFSLYIYYSLSGKILRRCILFTSILFISFSIIYYFKNNNDAFDLSASIESLLIIVFCLFYFFEQINTPTTSIIYSTSTFWIIVGMLFYLSGSLFLFLYVTSLPKNETFHYWYINNIFNILNKILFLIAFILDKDDPAEPLPLQRHNYI